MGWQARFRENCRQDSSGCWFWTAGRFSNGYGQFRVGEKKWRAHRLSWVMENGEIPKGMMVLHRCDTSLCVNPDHLYIGSHADNMRDRSARGRVASGERNGNAKLSARSVRKIRSSAAAGIKQSALALKYGVSVSMISYIVTRQNWTAV